MNEQSQDLKDQLLQTDEEFHQLAAKHHELEDRLHELTAKHYLSEPEQVEEVTLKKRKLQIKDRMEDILRQRTAVMARDVAAVSGALARPRATRHRAPDLRRKIGMRCVSIPPGCRSSSARWLLALWPARCCRLAARCRSSCSRAFFLFFFRDPDRRIAARRRRRAVAGRRPGAGRRRPALAQARAARAVAADQHLSLADGRARQPRSGVGRVTRVSYTPGRFLPAYQARRGRRQRAQRDLDRSRRPDGRRPADRRHPGAPRRLPRGGRRRRRAGDRYGIMKFGSRMDVFCRSTPTSACSAGRRRARRRNGHRGATLEAVRSRTSGHE